MPNQYLPLPPLDLILPHMKRYHSMQWNIKKIHEVIVEKHLDTTQYGIGLTRFRQYMVMAGLPGVRTQGHTAESIRPVMEELRSMYPKAGSREMKNILFHERQMTVSRPVLITYFETYEPELMRERRARYFKRKRFWCAGVNDLTVFDQHDKWKYKFGLALHIGLDPFSGIIRWLKVWWSNSNPRLIFSYYIEDVKERGYMCLVTQSDIGTENYGIANGHTMLRQLHDPSLVGTLQHRWKREKKNVIPEISWSQLRRRFTPGFEDLLDYGVNEGWYSPSDPLQHLIFRWVFIPWMQSELDAYAARLNLTKKRADRNKVLPHGVPLHIHEDPESYECLDFKIAVDPQHVATVEAKFAPPDHPVFNLVPPSFAEYAERFYAEQGSPVITRTNVWQVYLALLGAFVALDQEEATIHRDEWNRSYTLGRDDQWDHEPMALIDARPLLPPGGPLAEAGAYHYQGGVNGGQGLDRTLLNRLDQLNEEFEGEGPQIYANFSDDEDIEFGEW